MADTKKKTAETGLTPPKFSLKLTGEDGNAFSILARFQRAALRASWTQAQVRHVCDGVIAGDYDHLPATMINYEDVD